MTPQQMLFKATRDFESHFKDVRLGNPAQYFTHEGQKYDYIIVSGAGKQVEGQLYPVYDTAEEAVSAWREAVRQYENEAILYWRTLPEIAQDEKEKDFITGGKSPTFGKWKIYSRFRAVS